MKNFLERIHRAGNVGAGLLETRGEETQQHGRDQHDDDCLSHGVPFGVKSAV